MSVSAPDGAGDPRAAQKSRTRRDIVAAARELVRDGRVPSLPEVAERAGVSRATIYRYYPTPELLVADLALRAPAGPLARAARERGENGTPEQAARLVRHVAEWALEHEGALRAVLRVSLDPDSGVQRPGYRREWIADVLAPLEGEVPEERLRRLAAALTLLMGVDPLVCLRDIAGLEDPEDIAGVLTWTARTLVEATVAGV